MSARVGVGRSVGAAAFSLLLTFALLLAPLLVPSRTWQQQLGVRVVAVLIWALAIRFVLSPWLRATPAQLGATLSWGSVPRALYGALFGALALLVSFMIAWLAGGFVVTGGGAWDGLAKLGQVLLLFLVAGLFEELSFRVGLLASLRMTLSPSIAIGVSAAAFGLLHSLNPGASTAAVINTTLAGVLFGLLFLERKGKPGVPSLGAPLGFHVAWNVTEGCVLGSPVSGLPGSSRILDLEPVDLTWSGGSYGLEGGFAVTLVLALACVWAARRADLHPPKLGGTAQS